MSRQKQWKTEPIHAGHEEQMIAIREQSKQGLRVCRNIFELVPDTSSAQVLFRLCQCYVEIIQLLDLRNQHRNGSVKGLLHRVPDALSAAESDDTIQERLRQLLYFQQGLLQQLRKTIRLQNDRDLAYRLSASVATFQILHDHLSQLHRNA